MLNSGKSPNTHRVKILAYIQEGCKEKCDHGNMTPKAYLQRYTRFWWTVFRQPIVLLDFFFGGRFFGRRLVSHFFGGRFLVDIWLVIFFDGRFLVDVWLVIFLVDTT